MQPDQYDVVIVGAGINGCGVAQAAAAAGYRVLLIEKNTQPGLETSGSSSKLIHGGLRYLESLQFALVQESLQERELLLRLAPRLVRLCPFNIPVYRQTRRSRLKLQAGLLLYSVLAGRQPHHRYQRIARSQWQRLEGLRTEDLLAVYQYQDAQTDDTQLVRAVLASAVELGAQCRMRTELMTARKSAGGVDIELRHDGQTERVQCQLLVNAAGPWVSVVNERIQPRQAIQQTVLVQGAHLVIKQPVQQAYYLESPADGRAVFLLPWQGHGLLGTTELPLSERLEHPRVSDQERRYLLDVHRHYFPGIEQTVLQEMAGYRVLSVDSGTVFQRSREIDISVDDAARPRVISMIGGKLTVYRRSAIKVMQLAQQTLQPVQRRADTGELMLAPVPADYDF